MDFITISPINIDSNLNENETENHVTIYDIPYHIWEFIVKLVIASDRQFDTLYRQSRQFKTILQLRLVNNFLKEIIQSCDIGFFWSINKAEDIESFNRGPKKLFEINPGWSLNWIGFHFWAKDLPTLGNKELLSNFLNQNVRRLRCVEIEFGLSGLYEQFSDFMRAKQQDILLLQTLERFTEPGTKLKLEIQHRKMISEHMCFFHEIFPIDKNCELISNYSHFLMNALTADEDFMQIISPGSVFDNMISLYIRGNVTKLHLLKMLPNLKQLTVYGLNFISKVQLPQITELSIYNQPWAANHPTSIGDHFSSLQKFRFYAEAHSETSFADRKIIQLPLSCKDIETSQKLLGMFTETSKDLEELSLTVCFNRDDKPDQVNQISKFSHNLVSLILRYGCNQTIDDLFRQFLELAPSLPKLRVLKATPHNRHPNFFDEVRAWLSTNWISLFQLNNVQFICVETLSEVLILATRPNLDHTKVLTEISNDKTVRKIELFTIVGDNSDDSVPFTEEILYGHDYEGENFTPVSQQIQCRKKRSTCCIN